MARANATKAKFKRDDADAAEELLEGFVADEVEVLASLEDTERMASTVLSQVLDNPPMAMPGVSRDEINLAEAARRSA